MDVIQSLFLGALVSTVLSFGAGYGLAHLIEGQKKTHLRRTATESMIAELEDNQRYLLGRIKSKEEIQIILEKFRAGEYTFNVAQIGVNALESVIVSGSLKEFETETQLMIVKFVENVKLANKLNYSFFERIMVATEGDDIFVSNSVGLYQTILKAEEDCLSQIPILIKQLQPSLR